MVLLFILLSVLREIHYLFQGEFPTECDLVLPLSVSSFPLFFKVIQYLLTFSSSSSHHLHHSLYISFNKVFYKAVPAQDVNSPVILPSFYCLWDISLLLDSLQHFFISYRIGLTDLLYPSPAAHFNTSKKYLIYFPKCQISAPCKAIIQV